MSEETRWLVQQRVKSDPRAPPSWAKQKGDAGAEERAKKGRGEDRQDAAPAAK